MPSAKDIKLAQIGSRAANRIVRKYHYSNKVANNSQLHIGVYLEGALLGALQFGPPMDYSKIIGLVEGSRPDSFLELNRMAFSERLPRNSESRALAISLRLIGKHAPKIKWIISFADATQSGDGAIYRACGFLLTDIKENTSLYRAPNGKVIHHITMRQTNPSKEVLELGWQKTDTERTFIERVGMERLEGFMLRYIYFIDDSWRSRLTCPVLPYSAIDEAGARMYRGNRAGEAKG